MDHFDRMLPREIKLLVFRTLLEIWKGNEEEGLKKSERWIGEVGGRRELIKISRVSKSWLSLVFDGELWSTLSARSYANLPPLHPGQTTPSLSNLFLPSNVVNMATVSVHTNTLHVIASHAGPFLRSLDLRNLTSLSSSTMHKIALAASSAPLESARRSFEDGNGGHPGTLRLGLDQKEGVTRLTKLDLAGCRSFSGGAVNHLLAKSPFLRKVNLRALPVVTNATCDILYLNCPHLIALDLSRSLNVDSSGVSLLTGQASSQLLFQSSPPRPMKELRLAGLSNIDDDFMSALARGMPSLQILDLSGCKSLTDDHILAFITPDPDPSSSNPTIALTSKEMGRDPASSTIYFKRLTSLRHLNVSGCSRLTDVAFSHLAFAVPRLEFLEAAGFGTRLRDEGLTRLLATTEGIRKIDLEGASEVTDGVLGVLTPEGDEEGGTGWSLEHLVLSYCGRLTAEAMLRLVRGCRRLRVLEVDNTKISDQVVKEFVRLSTSRRILGAEIAVTDSRNLTKQAMTDLHHRHTRPRSGWRGFSALPFAYQDADLDPDLLPRGPGRSEVDLTRVVLKSFWGWGLVDETRIQVASARKKKAALAAVLASSGGDGGPSRSLTTVTGGRRLLGWRSSSGSGVVMLDGVASSSTTPPLGGGTPPSSQQQQQQGQGGQVGGAGTPGSMGNVNFSSSSHLDGFFSLYF
ncbi:hypothetical protein BDY24DRAFT_367996 [Mrakia frigida]|uniref:uncharacterized protein n=1 Tax=Mrakia frigida TaxID=29902 RepID=UPI003FCC0794